MLPECQLYRADKWAHSPRFFTLHGLPLDEAAMIGENRALKVMLTPLGSASRPAR
jgi:hypothetical protein